MQNRFKSPFFSPQVIGILCIIVLILVLIGIGFEKGCDNEKNKLDKPSLSETKDTIKAPDTLGINNKQAEQFDYLDQTFSSFIFDINEQDIAFLFASDSGERLKTIAKVRDTIEKSGKDLRFAMNAGIFLENGQPEGLYVNEGKEIAKLNLKKGSGNFYLQPNGVFFIDEYQQLGILESNEFKEAEVKPSYATQSGPLLLRNGVLHPKINKGSPNLRVRNGVGIITASKAVFMISEKPVNFYDFTMTFKERFGCTDVLYLDGVISEMYLPELGKEIADQIDFSGMIAITDK